MTPTLENGLTAKESFEERVCDLLHCDCYQQEIVCSTLHPYPIALVAFSPHSGENKAEVVIEEDGNISCHRASVKECDWGRSGNTTFYVEDLDMLLALTRREYFVPGTEEKRTVLELQVLDFYGGEGE